MKKIVLSLLAIGALTSATAMAEGYGMAGCGLGSVVNAEMGWSHDDKQLFAATTNGIAGSQMFGITTGTSNCGAAASSKAEGMKKKKKVAQEVYLQYNLAQLKAESAQGKGETLGGLATVFGCQNQLTGTYDDFASATQRHHAEIFGSNDTQVVWQNLQDAMAKDNVVCRG